MIKRKQKIAILLCLALIFPLTAAAQYEWQGPTPVSSGNCVDFVIDETTGNLHVVTGYRHEGLIYTILDSIGQELHREVIVANAPEGNLHWGPTIALDSQRRPHIAYKSAVGYPDATDPGEPYYTLSYIFLADDGWTHPIRLSENVWRGYIIRMAIDIEDHVHIAQSSVNGELKASLPPADDGPYGNVTYFRVKDGIHDLTEVMTFTDRIDYRVDSRFELAATPDGRIHLVWGNPDYHNGVRQLPYYRSDDGGESWQFIEDLFVAGLDKRGASPDLFVSGDGALHMVYGTMRYDSKGTIYYLRYQGDSKQAYSNATPPGAIDWGWGNASVAATSQSEYIAVAFLSSRGDGRLYATLSTDGGQSWSSAQQLAEETADPNDDGRNTHLLRAYKNHFYLIYPVGNHVYLYMLKNLGDDPPVASAGGAYAATEGQSVRLDATGSTDSGLNAGIHTYAWDWNSDGTADTTTTQAQLNVSFPDNFTGEIILEITDRAGNTDKDTTDITIANAAPLVNIGGGRTVGEGDSLYLHAMIEDPGVADTHLLSWDLTGGRSSDSTHVKAMFPNNGQYIVSLQVTDDDGAVTTDTAQISVFNRPPVASAGGPYRVVPGENLTVTGTGVDPGPEDTVTGHWDMDGNGVFEVNGFSANISFSALGTYEIVFEARDVDGGADRDTAEVFVANEAPEIQAIDNQTIDEGESFLPIALDEFVIDNEQAPELLTWSFSGNEGLLATLSAERIFTVTPPDSEWTGQEVIRLIVTDPMGLKDTADIAFTVNSINDAPRWLGTLEYTFNEDDSLKVPLSLLQTLVFDPDHAPGTLAFSVESNQYIDGAIFEARGLWQFWGAPNWYGKETVQWVVTDPEGATAMMELPFVVQGIADAPLPFDLLTPTSFDSTAWPELFRFKWQATADPDSNDAVFYVLHISSQGGDATWSYQSPTLADTALTFRPPQEAESGMYFWWVEARDIAGHKTESRNSGTLLIRSTGVEALENISVPDEFRLLQNHPNPFNPETQITYHLPQAAFVQIQVYNMLGQVIRVLVDGDKGPGVHTAIWNGRDAYGNMVPTGVYLCRMSSGTHTFMRKMMLMQ